VADDITVLLASSDAKQKLDGLKKSCAEKSFFHILQVAKLISDADSAVAETARTCATELAEHCLQPGHSDIPEAVVFSAVSIVKEYDPHFVKQLNAKLASDEESEIVDSLRNLKYFITKQRAKTLLQKFLTHPDKTIRAAAVVHLGGIMSSILDDHLAEFLHDSDNRVKANAIEVMENSDNKIFIKVLNHFRIDGNNRVRANALKALYRLGEFRIGDDLLFMLMDPDPQMRASAAWVVGELGSKAAGLFKLLFIVMNDHEEIVLKNLSNAVRKIGPAPEIVELRKSLPKLEE
jgi:HEAT repeat protein